MSYNVKVMNELISFINNNNKMTKNELIKAVSDKFQLDKKRSVYVHKDFSIRFSHSKKNSTSFSNTILSIKTLKNYDDKPFVVCLSTPDENHIFLANSSFLNKVSHSSKRLTLDNLVGSFNGSNIMKSIGEFENCPKNFQKLYKAHEEVGFAGNIERLVENTHNTVGIGEIYSPNEQGILNIRDSVNRTKEFIKSKYYKELLDELDKKVKDNSAAILSTRDIDNVNLRGREIEILISNQGNDSNDLLTSNDLSDYDSLYPGYNVGVDIKSKMLDRNSSPKGYNIDKLLEFLSKDNTVYLIYIIGIEDNKIYTKLITVFDEEILGSTRIVDNWSGLNSRGTTQYNGDSIKSIVMSDKNIENNINEDKVLSFINELI